MKQYILRSTSLIKQRFDFVIIFCVIFNCFTIPVEIAFSPKSMKHTLFFAFNSVVDFLFLIDIIVCFRVTYINDFGIEISDPDKIKWRYIKGTFIIDLFATIPFDVLMEAIVGYEISSLNFFGLFKLGRLLRINKIIQFLNASRDFKAGAKLINLIFFLLIYLHCFACALWLSVSEDKLWIPYFL